MGSLKSLISTKAMPYLKAMRIASRLLIILLLPCTDWSQEVARMYVYAHRETPLRSWLPIMLDGAPIAKIKRGTFFAVNLGAGRHAVSCNKCVPLFVDVQSGKESYVRIGQQMEIGEPATLVFDTVHERVAQNEMRFVVYIDSKVAISNSVPKTDPRKPRDIHLKRRDD